MFSIKKYQKQTTTNNFMTRAKENTSRIFNDSCTIVGTSGKINNFLEIVSHMLWKLSFSCDSIQIKNYVIWVFFCQSKNSSKSATIIHNMKDSRKWTSHSCSAVPLKYISFASCVFIFIDKNLCLSPTCCNRSFIARTHVSHVISRSFYMVYL